MFKLFVVLSIIAVASCAPAVVSPLLAKVIGPEAPASTSHATHLAAAPLIPLTYAASPLTYAASPLTYAASPLTYAASPLTYAASPLAYPAGYHLSYSSLPVEQHGYRIAY